MSAWAVYVHRVSWIFHNGPIPAARVGQMFGVTSSTIQAIARNKTWKHVK